ncbi:MAG TPA: radical SAM protein [Gemmataceae bacterium]|nr:radical SAM protein [Gemmataceae bacterium]
MSAVRACHLQMSPAIRLRREAWGGVAFDRAGGDLLELDGEGFALLAALRRPLSLPAMRRQVRAGRPTRGFELAAFLRDLERRGFVRRVPPSARPLPPDRWAEEAPARAVGLRGPLVAHWAVTYRCNLSCAFCYSQSGPHREPGPEAATRRRLVERLAEWGVLEVALGGGEPTVLPDFPRLLCAIRSAGLVPNVTTNGTVRSAAVMRALAEHAGVVQLSADRPDLLDAARGPGVFARLRQTAGALRAAGVRLGVNLLLTPDNVGDLDECLRAMLDLGAGGVTFLRPKGAWAAEHWPGFPSDGDLARLADTLRRFLDGRPSLRLYVDTALRGEWSRLGLLDDPEPDVLGCGGGQRHVAVTPEGDVYPCSHQRRPEYRMGNLLTDDLERLWAMGSGHAGRQRYLCDCRGTICPCRSRPMA